MNLKAYQVAKIIDGVVEGNDQISINKLSKIESGEEGSLSFLGNPKYNNFLYSSKSSIIIINKYMLLIRSILFNYSKNILGITMR